MKKREVLTVGHSNHEPEKYVALLRSADIRLVVDVRSQPFSRFAPHFNRPALEKILTGADIGYRHEPYLGGRPDDPSMYDAAGHVLYGLVADSQLFRAAVDELERLADTTTVAIMCGEEDPAECHRRLLVGRVLEQRGREVLHLRGDGRIQSEEELPASAAAQEGLFEGGEFSTWRSIRSVLPRSRPPGSSAH